MNILIMGIGVCGKTTLADHISMAAQAQQLQLRVATARCRSGRPVWKSLAVNDAGPQLDVKSEYRVVVWLCRSTAQLQAAQNHDSDSCIGVGSTQITLILQHPWPPKLEHAEPFYERTAFQVLQLIGTKAVSK